MDMQKQKLIEFAKLVAAGNTEIERLEELAREAVAEAETPRAELEEEEEDSTI